MSLTVAHQQALLGPDRATTYNETLARDLFCLQSNAAVRAAPGVLPGFSTGSGGRSSKLGTFSKALGLAGGVVAGAPIPLPGLGQGIGTVTNLLTTLINNREDIRNDSAREDFSELFADRGDYLRAAFKAGVKVMLNDTRPIEAEFLLHENHQNFQTIVCWFTNTIGNLTPKSQDLPEVKTAHADFAVYAQALLLRKKNSSPNYYGDCSDNERTQKLVIDMLDTWYACVKSRCPSLQPLPEGWQIPRTKTQDKIDEQRLAFDEKIKEKNKQIEDLTKAFSTQSHRITDITAQLNDLRQEVSHLQTEYKITTNYLQKEKSTTQDYARQVRQSSVGPFSPSSSTSQYTMAASPEAMYVDSPAMTAASSEEDRYQAKRESSVFSLSGQLIKAELDDWLSPPPAEMQPLLAAEMQPLLATSYAPSEPSIKEEERMQDWSAETEHPWSPQPGSVSSMESPFMSMATLPFLAEAPPSARAIRSALHPLPNLAGSLKEFWPAVQDVRTVWKWNAETGRAQEHIDHIYQHPRPQTEMPIQGRLELPMAPNTEVIDPIFGIGFIFVVKSHNAHNNSYIFSYPVLKEHLVDFTKVRLDAHDPLTQHLLAENNATDYQSDVILRMNPVNHDEALILDQTEEWEIGRKNISKDALTNVYGAKQVYNILQESLNLMLKINATITLDGKKEGDKIGPRAFKRFKGDDSPIKFYEVKNITFYPTFPIQQSFQPNPLTYQQY